jgi:hypothetical protein
MKELDAKFDNFHNHILKELCLPEETILLLYLNAFEGQFSLS